MELELDRITVNYETFGQGRPLVALPGWSLSAQAAAREFEPIFAERPGWQRIYIDPPGHGFTPGPAWVTGQDQILEVILAFVDRLLPGRRFALAGWSLGAYLARGVLFHRPELVNGLMMTVPCIWAEDGRRTVSPPQVLVEDPAVMAELTPAEAEMFELVVVRSRRILDVLRDPAWADDGPGDPEFLQAIREDPARYAFSYDVDALAEPFPGPTLIIAGRQDCVVGYRDAWGLLENYPRATFVVLDRAGHFMEEKAGLIRTLAHDWLDRLEETSV
jgi:pimeloyl-ACP methyl ester carboxylesterase